MSITGADLNKYAMKIKKASCPEDMFGKEQAEAKNAYRQLARLLHPDLFVEEDKKKKANDAFQGMQILWQQAEAKIKEGTYGNFKPHIVASKVITLQKKDKTFVISDLIGKDFFSNRYQCVVQQDGKETNAVFHVTRSEKDNDLIQRETDSLHAIHEKLSTHEHSEIFFPRLNDSFFYRDASDAQRRKSNVINSLPEGFVSLAEVKKAYPHGLHPLDMAWMWRRLLHALGWVENIGLVHGAVLPENVMIHPAEHGLILDGWYNSTKKNGRIPVIEVGKENFYPEEIEKKQSVSAATDIYMAAKVMTYLMEGSNVPIRLTRFFKGCTLLHNSQRPDKPWVLLDEFDALLEEITGGPRKFRPFSLTHS